VPSRRAVCPRADEVPIEKANSRRCTVSSMDYLQVYFAGKPDDKSQPQLTVAKLALGETPA
ncbi:hypothetical protein, partial [Mesorhizobium sp.]|uniref:hypothetical protein n=1 Tax=Mesorhizobium sp. TaxID=1871066 RepID=UPI0032AF96A2